MVKEIETIENPKFGNNEPMLSRRTFTETVSPSGKIAGKHDFKVTGFMNYKERQSYAISKSKGMLIVASPRSLLRKSTERMYLPRNDKFEGYSQFPRPRVPPENKKFDSFINRANS